MINVDDDYYCDVCHGDDDIYDDEEEEDDNGDDDDDEEKEEEEDVVDNRGNNCHRYEDDHSDSDEREENDLQMMKSMMTKALTMSMLMVTRRTISVSDEVEDSLLFILVGTLIMI